MAEEKVVHLYGPGDAFEAPPIDCRMKWGGRAVIVSETTAVLLMGAMRELQRAGGMKAHNADGARILAQCFDECDLIERDVAGRVMAEGELG